MSVTRCLAPTAALRGAFGNEVSGTAVASEDGTGLLTRTAPAFRNAGMAAPQLPLQFASAADAVHPALGDFHPLVKCLKRLIVLLPGAAVRVADDLRTRARLITRCSG